MQRIREYGQELIVIESQIYKSSFVGSFFLQTSVSLQMKWKSLVTTHFFKGPLVRKLQFSNKWTFEQLGLWTTGTLHLFKVLVFWKWSFDALAWFLESVIYCLLNDLIILSPVPCLSYSLILWNFLRLKLVKAHSRMMRPHLEYGQCIWSPFLMKYINMIEHVQWRATKLVDGLSNKDYSTRLKEPWLTTLWLRQIRGNLIEMLKDFTLFFL